MGSLALLIGCLSMRGWGHAQETQPGEKGKGEGKQEGKKEKLGSTTIDKSSQTENVTIFEKPGEGEKKNRIRSRVV
jgi:hypothetical protein